MQQENSGLLGVITKTRDGANWRSELQLCNCITNTVEKGEQNKTDFTF